MIFYFLKMYLGDPNRQPQSSRENLGTPRPNVPSQKAWLEIASDNHSRIFTTLLPYTAFIDSNLFIVYTHTYSTTTLVCTTDG